MYRVTNTWGKVSIFCMNHDKPVPMKIINNTEQIKTPFYACENYAGLNGEAPCYNRLNLDDYQGIVMKVLGMVAEDQLTLNLTNYSFDYKGPRQKIHVKVLKHNDDEIQLGIFNNTVLGG